MTGAHQTFLLIRWGDTVGLVEVQYKSLRERHRQWQQSIILLKGVASQTKLQNWHLDITIGVWNFAVEMYVEEAIMMKQKRNEFVHAIPAFVVRKMVLKGKLGMYDGNVI